MKKLICGFLSILFCIGSIGYQSVYARSSEYIKTDASHTYFLISKSALQNRIESDMRGYLDDSRSDEFEEIEGSYYVYHVNQNVSIMISVNADNGYVENISVGDYYNPSDGSNAKKIGNVAGKIMYWLGASKKADSIMNEINAMYKYCQSDKGMFGATAYDYVFYSLNYSKDDTLDGSGRNVTSLNMVPCAYRSHAQFMDSPLFEGYAQTYCGLSD